LLEEAIAAEAQWQADRAEMVLGRLMGRAEQDAGIDIAEAVIWTGVVGGYAGPTRVAYDERAVGEESPLVVQALDRRFYHEQRGPHGAEEVVYSRRGRLKDLQAEGWRVDLPGRPDSPAALHDYWCVRRVPDGAGRWRKEIWHAIVVEAGGTYGPATGSGRAGRTWGAFAKPPTLMEGLTAIPYAVRGVRPAVIRAPEFDSFEVNAFADVLWLLFEPMSRVLSWSHQLSHLAAVPNVTVKAPMGTGVDVDVTTPGAHSTVPEGTEVKLNIDPAQAQILATQGGRLQDLAEKASFAGATLGQGIHQSSGLMTTRLQEAGAEALISTRKACVGVLADTYRNLAMVARAYRPDLVADLKGRETIGVELPGMSRQEVIRLLADVQRVTAPDGRGVGLVSEDTGLELVGLPYVALEERKKQRQARTWGHGDLVTRRHGDAETRRRGDAEMMEGSDG
jgi:hypothetical protein